MLELGTEKMSKSVGNIRGLAEVLDEVGRDTLIWFFCEGHYRQPLAFSRERLEDAARRVERIRDAGPAARAGRLAGRRWRRTATRSSTRWPTTTTRRGRSRRWRSGSARRTARTGRSATAHLREMLGVLGLDNLLERDEGAPAEVVELAERRAAARAARDFAEADRLRDELRARGWEVRDGAGGAELVPIGPDGRVIVYGRNAVREAHPRAAAGAHACGPRRARRASSRARVPGRARDEIARRCGSDGHQGVCADVEEYRYADAADAAARARPGPRRARRGDRPAEPRRGLPHRRVHRRDRA